MIFNSTQNFTKSKKCSKTGPQVKARLQATTELMMSEITRLHRNEASSFNARERDSFVKLCSTVVNELLPFVNTCLSHLFPQETIFLQFGNLSKKIRELKNKYILNPSLFSY